MHHTHGSNAETVLMYRHLLGTTSSVAVNCAAVPTLCCPPCMPTHAHARTPCCCHNPTDPPARRVLQTDRESTISDFKGGVCSVLVATSVAARGLDVRDLSLVLNYDTPNHLEEYVHRCGRTGRAGAAGTAITFLADAEEQYAPDLVKALKDSKKPVPQDLQARAARRTRGGGCCLCCRCDHCLCDLLCRLALWCLVGVRMAAPALHVAGNPCSAHTDVLQV